MANLLQYWANFHCCKWPNIKKSSLTIWSHWSDLKCFLRDGKCFSFNLTFSHHMMYYETSHFLTPSTLNLSISNFEHKLWRFFHLPKSLSNLMLGLRRNASSATRWPNYLFNIWPFIYYNLILPNGIKISQNRFKMLPNTK